MNRERNSDDFSPHFVKVIDDDDAFADDDDFVALLWKRNNATVVYVEIVKALVFIIISLFSF